MGSTWPMWVGLDLYNGLGWVEFFLTHHDGLSQKIPSTRPMHTPSWKLPSIIAFPLMGLKFLAFTVSKTNFIIWHITLQFTLYQKFYFFTTLFKYYLFIIFYSFFYSVSLCLSLSLSKPNSCRRLEPSSSLWSALKPVLCVSNLLLNLCSMANHQAPSA